MEDGIEYAIEAVIGGIMFCAAVIMLMLLFISLEKSVDGVENMEEQLILYKETEEA